MIEDSLKNEETPQNKEGCPPWWSMPVPLKNKDCLLQTHFTAYSALQHFQVVVRPPRVLAGWLVGGLAVPEA